MTAPVNNFETGGMCKSYCYIICCCTYILYTLCGSQNSEHGPCQTTVEVCLANHQSWSIQPEDRGARSSAQHQVASKQMCVISQLTCVCPWWHIYPV